MNSLKSLNLSFNSSRIPGNFISKSIVQNSQLEVTDSIVDFIHYSDTLLHIDLGGMDFDFEDLTKIIQKGLRRSRTLLSCHLIGANNFG